MKYLLVFLLSALAIPVLSQTVINDKNAQVREVTSFSGIKVSGGIDVYLSQGDDYALAVSASDDKYRDDIKTEVNNGILVISYDGGSLRFNTNRRLRAYVSFRTLESLEASGASDFILDGGFHANSARIRLSGACVLKGKIDIVNLQLRITGASSVRLAGSVQNLHIDASGASDAKNYDLVVDNCVADLSGASDVRLTINKTVSAKASGASTLYYTGNPEKKEIHTSGASSISDRD
jgi:hypothetical protein